MRTAVLTVSTSAARHETQDESGPALARLADAAGCDVVALEVVSDDGGLIEDRLRHWVDDGVPIVLTTGGTGFTPDDCTPEAALCVIERRATGLEAALHAEARARHPMGALSRARRGPRGPDPHRHAARQPAGGGGALPGPRAAARPRRRDAPAVQWRHLPLSRRSSWSG